MNKEKLKELLTSGKTTEQVFKVLSLKINLVTELKHLVKLLSEKKLNLDFEELFQLKEETEQTIHQAISYLFHYSKEIGINESNDYYYLEELHERRKLKLIK